MENNILKLSLDSPKSQFNILRPYDLMPYDFMHLLANFIIAQAVSIKIELRANNFIDTQFSDKTVKTFSNQHFFN